MRRRAVGIFTSLLLLACVPVWGQLDSARLAQLDVRLEEYFRALEAESAEVKKGECDALVRSAEDSLLRQRIALKVYDHYLNSALMGDDAVAVHFVDRWFASGEIAMRSEVDLINAKVFAQFNRQSLIGCKAPELDLQTPDGSLFRVGGPSERFTVLFFFDTACAKCKLETVLLKSLLEKKNPPVSFCAIYAGTDALAWKQWREEKFSIEAPDLDLKHLWDPELSSDFQLKYGVVQTPRIFLLRPDGVIAGRGLDSEALDKLLDISLKEQYYDYSSPASMELFENLFSFYDPLEASDVTDAAAMIEARTLARGDTTGFRHLEGSLLYFLSSKRGEQWCAGTLSFVNEYVLTRPKIWTSRQDSLQVVSFSRMISDLLSRTPEGSRIPKTSFSGWNRLRRKGGVLVFHTEGCRQCEAELDAARKSGIRHLAVNVDRLLESDPGLTKMLFNTFDLSVLPFVVEISRGGVVRRKYITLTQSSEEE